MLLLSPARPARHISHMTAGTDGPHARARRPENPPPRRASWPAPDG
uniref:Uncharacterized protein n=1 Tax=Nonomuraea gerenzanensis TaxID=93944 RepID=A0A1M4ELW1_9ACTN|nr:hypothetical protein BN4615_P9356 [Nonomuraea gerenzanensis]